MKRSQLPNLAMAGCLLVAGLAPLQAQQIRIVPGGKEKAKVVSLDPLLETAKLWELTPDAAEAKFKASGFQWLTKGSKDRAIMKNESWGPDAQQMKMFKNTQPVAEVGFEFKEDAAKQLKLAMVTITAWNKGDAEDEYMTEGMFKELVEKWTTQLSATIAPKFENRGKDNASASKAERRMWLTPETMVQLEWSGGKGKMEDIYTGRQRSNGAFQGEFIRIRMAPKTKSMVFVDVTSGGQTKMTRTDVVRNVKKDPNGDVIVPNIPMVDQGDKGYCAVAAAARVLNYYGIPADQHEMAQVARTGNSGGGGTSIKEMEDALSKVSGRFAVRYRHLMAGSDEFSDRAYKRTMDDYNRNAKRMGKPQLDANRFYFSLDDLDPGVLRETKGKGPNYEKFAKAVRENIDKGIPLLWGLELGIYPENGEKAMQFGGGHMRLIIGYNFKDPAKHQIYFSDTWGAGHEKKWMAAADAAAATSGLYVLEPAAQ